MSNDTLALLRYLAAATHFSVGCCTVEHYSNDDQKGWAVSLGAWLYSNDGSQKWKRSAATRWHRAECLILTLGEAFALAEKIDQARRAER